MGLLRFGQHLLVQCGQAVARRLVRAISHPANATSRKTTQRNNVASALTSGLTPRRTLENTAIGKVVADGPVTKLATTKSSSDSVNARSQPDTRAGLITGRVIRVSTVQGRAPRSSAASSRARSKPANWARTSTDTKQAPNVACATVIVSIPRLGQPNQVSHVTNNSSSDRPRMTSGTTSGASNATPNTRRPGNRANRAMLKPAIAPSTRERVAAVAATSRLVSAAAPNAPSWNSAPYQWV